MYPSEAVPGRFRWVWLLPVLVIGGGCGSPQPPTVHLSAAASLQDVIEAQVQRIESSSNLRVRLSTAGSQAVARQVLEGSSTDVVFLAHSKWMDRLASNGRVVHGTRFGLLTNQLVLITARSPPPIGALGDLASYRGRLALGQPRAVPAGVYARKTLENLGWWSALRSRVVAFPHVRAVLTAVASGEAPLGIVYRTDVRREPEVRVLATLPDRAVPPIVYPLALVSGHRPSARRVYEALRSPEARPLYRRFGFGIRGTSPENGGERP